MCWSQLMAALAVVLMIVAGRGGVAAAAPDRPLVFTPGILGSRLCDARGAVVWGNRSSLNNFQHLEITGSPSDKQLQPCGIIEEIQLLGGFWSVDKYRLCSAMLLSDDAPIGC